MRKVLTAILGGIATLAVAAVAVAAHRDMHIMNVGLPVGSVARIEYEGDVAPKVIVAPAPKAVPVNFLEAVNLIPFAAFDRIAAPMSHDMDAMAQEISAFQPVPPFADGNIDLAALAKLPPGALHYQFVSTSDGGGTCNRSVEVTSYGRGQKPKVVSSSAGDCASTKRVPMPTQLDSPSGPTVPALTRTGKTAVAERVHAANTI